MPGQFRVQGVGDRTTQEAQDHKPAKPRVHAEAPEQQGEKAQTDNDPRNDRYGAASQ
jgi:hypothetical protein